MSTIDTENPASSGSSIRWWPLVIILVLAAGRLTWVWVFADLTLAWRHVHSGTVLVATVVASLAWLAFLSRLPQAIRWGSAGVLTSLIGMAFALLRIDSVSGDLVPQFRWRWEKKQHESLQSLPTESPILDELPDLSAQMPHNYPQFLGPNRNATLSGVGLARDWTRPPHRLWSIPLGAGWSAFAVAGDYAVTQEQRGPQEMVTCYRLLTGELCWSHADEAYYSSKMAGDGPRATPTISEDGKVYTVGATGLLNCLDGRSGKPLWAPRNLLTDSGDVNATWGKSCSPLLVDDLVVVTGGATKSHSLLAYDRHSGALVWKSEDDSTRNQSYVSAMVATLGGVRQLLTMNDNNVAGHEIATGKLLWQYPWPGSEPKVTQPLPVGGDQLFIASGYGVGCALLQLKQHDGSCMVEKELWNTRELKPKFTNVVHRDGFIYGLDEGILVCIDLKDGTRRWKQGRYQHGQIMLVDDLLLVQAESGEVVLVEANAERHHELGRFPALAEKTWNNPTLSTPYLLVRNDREAACFELPLAPKPVVRDVP